MNYSTEAKAKVKEAGPLEKLYRRENSEGIQIRRPQADPKPKGDIRRAPPTRPLISAPQPRLQGTATTPRHALFTTTPSLGNDQEDDGKERMTPSPVLAATRRTPKPTTGDPPPRT